MSVLAMPYKRIDPQAIPPKRHHDEDAGFDLSYPTGKPAISLDPGETRAVPTGIALRLPAGTVGLIAPRSGLALRHGVTVLNAPGILDAGFRGEVQVLLHNTSDTTHWIEDGDRIAQLVITPYEAPQTIEVDDLGDTDRGAHGFGSTGA